MPDLRRHLRTVAAIALGLVLGALTRRAWAVVSEQQIYAILAQLQAVRDGGAAVVADAPITGNGTGSNHLGCRTASASQSGCLSSTDYISFDSKQAALSLPLPTAYGGTGVDGGVIDGGLAYGAGGAYAFMDAGTPGQCAQAGDAGVPIWGACGSGTVTSAGLSLPAEFTVTNSPVTTTGTLTGAWANESVNVCMCGPGSGSATTPGFRTLVTADLPTAWKTAYSVDFTTLSTQNLITGGDGSKTIDGHTWTVAGTGGATTFGITNGTGLVMTRASVDLELKTSFANLGSIVVGHDDIELWYMATNANINAANEFAAIGVANSTVSPGTNYKAVTGRRNDAGADRWATLYQYNAATSGIPESSAGTTHDVIVARYHAPNIWVFWSGASSSGSFPAFSALTYRGVTVLWSSIDSSFTYGDTTVMGPYLTASNGDTKITLQKMQILVRQ